MGIYMLLSTALFRARESWSLHESMYFMWISFSTIGLGDYAPDHNGLGGVWPLILHTVVGLSLVAALLTSLGSKVQEKDCQIISSLDVDGDGDIQIAEVTSFFSTPSARLSSTPQGERPS